MCVGGGLLLSAARHLTVPPHASHGCLRQRFPSTVSLASNVFAGASSSASPHSPLPTGALPGRMQHQTRERPFPPPAPGVSAGRDWLRTWRELWSCAPAAAWKRWWGQVKRALVLPALPTTPPHSVCKPHTGGCAENKTWGLLAALLRSPCWAGHINCLRTHPSIQRLLHPGWHHQPQQRYANPQEGQAGAADGKGRPEASTSRRHPDTDLGCVAGRRPRDQDRVKG
jgi:hypothetical protein